MKAEHLPRYIDRRMKELGVDSFSEETVSLYLAPGENLSYDATGKRAFFYEDSIRGAAQVRVESNFGLLSEGGKHRLQQWEHTGRIRFVNPGPAEHRISFILVSPH